MDGGIDLTGMVLLAAPVGEYDRRVVLLTKERGKITAFARGARRPKSALIASTSPFSFGTFKLYEGRNAYTLVSAQISNYFSPIREDMEGVCYGSYFMEFASYYGRENLDASEMLNLLYASLLALEKENIPNKLVRAVYEVKLMQINGEYPQDEAYSPDLSETARYVLQFIFATPIRKLFTFSVSDEVIRELVRLQRRVIQKFVDASFHSLPVLEVMTSS